MDGRAEGEEGAEEDDCSMQCSQTIAERPARIATSTEGETGTGKDLFKNMSFIITGLAAGYSKKERSALGGMVEKYGGVQVDPHSFKVGKEPKHLVVVSSR